MNRYRAHVYQLLKPREYNERTFAWWFEFGLIALISLNVIAVLLATVEPLFQRYETAFYVFEVFSVTMFTLEYLARVWSCVEEQTYQPGWRGRLRYMATPMAIIDLLAILPFYLSIFITADLRILRALRLLRVFKLTRYSSAMSLLLNVLKEEASTLLACFFILFILLIIASSGAYLVEHRAQPDHFGSIPATMWWALVTLTTVGYGDVTPITPIGRIFGGMVTIIGVGVAALPAGILASGLNDQLHRRRDDLRDNLKVALEGGVIDANDESELEALRKKLGISLDIAQQIRDEVSSSQQKKKCTCPYCGKRFDLNNDSNLE